MKTVIAMVHLETARSWPWSVRLHVTLDLFNKVSVGAPPCNKDPVDTGVQLRGEFTD